MVCVEAMACGTPVVALANGALSEVVENGWTGYVTSDPGEMAHLVVRALSLDRHAVRARAAERFDMRGTADRYLALYQEILLTAKEAQDG